MRELIERARDGDAGAFTAAIAPSIDRLHGAAYLVLRDRLATEDAVQDGLLRAWQRLPSLRDPDRFDGWVRRIVMRAAIDVARARRSSVELDHEPAVASSTADDVVTRDLVGTAFARLTPMHRAVLALRHYLDLTVPEIANALGVPEGTAKSRLHHAHQSMRDALAEVDPADEGRVSR